jgi:hypothetical protein
MPLRHKIAAETTISTTFFVRLHAKGIPFMASIAYSFSFFFKKMLFFSFWGRISLLIVHNCHSRNIDLNECLVPETKTRKTTSSRKNLKKRFKENISNWHELRSYADSPLAKPVSELPLLPLDFHQSQCE